jgi:Uma2 family endonuclease
MSAVFETIPQPTVAPPLFTPPAEEILYPDSHEDDMGESDLHYGLLAYLWSALQVLWGKNDTVYVAANMNLYYVEGRPEYYFTPDIMVLWGVPNQRRKVYKLWEERVFPQVIIEVASDRTWKNDLSEKMKFYGEMGVEEYYVLYSEDFLPVPLMAYRQENGRLKPMYLPEDAVFSPRLGVEIRLTENGFRFFNITTQKFMPTLEESEAEVERLRAEIAALKEEKH